MIPFRKYYHFHTFKSKLVYMMRKLLPILIASCFLCCSKSSREPNAFSNLTESTSIGGKEEYLGSPYVTAGNRVYMVGHQDGSFPQLGWHIKGEMGGIWNHPIKLMDGFDASISTPSGSFPLNKASKFENYPFGNKHTFISKDSSILVERFQFVPDDIQGIQISYKIKNQGTVLTSLDFEFIGHSDLSPTWLGERTNMIDNADQSTYLEDLGAWQIRDGSNPWFVLFGSDKTPQSYSQPNSNYDGKGISNLLKYSVQIDANDERYINFYIAGSYKDLQDAKDTYGILKSKSTQLLQEKKGRYEELSEMSKLTIPDKDLQTAFEWLKYNCDWLVRTVPEIGTGVTAGIPDYPWWFGVDSEYALKGYMAIGQTDPVYSTIELLDSVSKAVNGNGKIIHEMSTNGAVFNDGNINETPQFASLIWEVYKWNGDTSFLKKYFPTIKKGLEWLMLENDADGNLFPDGFGMMEIHGLDSEMIDVASYTQRAFEDASKMASELGKDSLAIAYDEKATLLRQKINDVFWSEAYESYADFIGTDQQSIQLIEDAVVRADTLNKPWAVQELQNTKKQIQKNPSNTPRAFVVHHNWVVNTPMEMKLADSSKAIKALNTAEKFVNPFGVFVTGIDRDESAGSDDGSFKGSKVFSYTGAVMTLPTGVQAVAENNYGRPDKALNYLKRMTRTFSYALPGSIYEVSPDYGMMTQAWNIYSFAVPIVNQFFGIKPMASEKIIIIEPNMPSTWNDVSLENVKVGENEISIYYTKNIENLELRINQTNPDWKLEVLLPKTPGLNYENMEGYNSKKSTKTKAHFTFIKQHVELKL